MPVTLTGPSWTAMIARLRSAGCVFAEDEARLLADAAESHADLAAMVDRRAAGLPVEHVIGWAGFCGLRLAVEPGVFVPRPRSEFLVREALRLARQDQPGRAGQLPVIVDLCCGTGAIGAALAAALGTAELHAADIDPAAVRCARRNLAARGARVYQGDLFDPLPAALRGRVTLLVADAPYVPTGQIALLPPEARLHEARAALDGGADGLSVIRRIAAVAPCWLAPGGHLLVEASSGQAADAAAVLAGQGLMPSVTSSEDLGATVVGGTRRPASRDGSGRHADGCGGAGCDADGCGRAGCGTVVG
jgi:release factor glutamine methyltransferase